MKLLSLGTLSVGLLLLNGCPAPDEAAIHAETATHAETAAHAQTAGHAETATRADAADSVAWTDIEGRPAWSDEEPSRYSAGNGLALTGSEFSVPVGFRTTWVPARSMSYDPTSTGVGPKQFGIQLAATSNAYVGFSMPVPEDYVVNPAFPLSVELLFTVPFAPGPGDFKWRLYFKTSEYDALAGNATNGWDQLSSGQAEEGVLTTYPAAPSQSELLKWQKWTAKDQSGGRYFGTSITTGNRFTAPNMIWSFHFARGKSVNNGETNTGPLTIVGARVRYGTSR